MSGEKEAYYRRNPDLKPEQKKPAGYTIPTRAAHELHYNAFLKHHLGPDMMCVINDNATYGMLGEEVSITPASEAHHATHYQSTALPYSVALATANTLTNEYGFINPKHFTIINNNEGSTLVVTRAGLEYAQHNADFVLRVPEAPLIDMKHLGGFAAQVTTERSSEESEQRALGLLGNIASSTINRLGWHVDKTGNYVIEQLAADDFQRLGEALNEERISYRVPQSDFSETGEQIRPHTSMIVSPQTMRGITERAAALTR